MTHVAYRMAGIPVPARRALRFRLLLVVVAATTLTVSGCSATTSGAPSRLLINGLVLASPDRSVTPAVAGTTLTGDHFDISTWRGQIVVINFWGSWCAPCRTEAPNLQRVAMQTHSSGVRFLGIDIRDSRDSALGFERSFGITYPSVFDQASTQGLKFGHLAPQATPSTLVLDRQGRVAARFIGATEYAPLLATVNQLLAQG